MKRTVKTALIKQSSGNIGELFVLSSLVFSAGSNNVLITSDNKKFKTSDNKYFIVANTQ